MSSPNVTSSSLIELSPTAEAFGLLRREVKSSGKRPRWGTKHWFQCCTRRTYSFLERLSKHLMSHTLPVPVAVDSTNLILQSQMLRVSLRSCHWVKGESNWFIFSSTFFRLFVFPPPLQWHKLMVSGRKVIALGSSSIIWCSQILWLSGSGLKCSSMLKNDSKNGTAGFRAYHL